MSSLFCFLSGICRPWPRSPIPLSDLSVCASGFPQILPFSHGFQILLFPYGKFFQTSLFSNPSFSTHSTTGRPRSSPHLFSHTQNSLQILYPRGSFLKHLFSAWLLVSPSVPFLTLWYVSCSFLSLPNSFFFSQTVKKQSGSRGPPLTPQGPDGGQRG